MAQCIIITVLVDNIANYYCVSHQAELARHCYLPAFRHFVGLVTVKMAVGDKSSVARGALGEFRERALAMSLLALRIDVPRTRESFCRALDAVLSVAGKGGEATLGKWCRERTWSMRSESRLAKCRASHFR